MRTPTKNIIISQLLLILKNSAPIRGQNIPVGRKMPKDYSDGEYGQSRYPGNLMNNGILLRERSTGAAKVIIGGAAAPYGVWTETRSFRKKWQEKSTNDFLQKLQNLGGKLR